MTAPTDVDTLIIGGGAAGLSLACALRSQLPEGSLTIVEPRLSYRRDRTWCYWDVVPTKLDGLASHSWQRWRIGVDGETMVCHSDRYTYRHIAADRFYQHALEHLLPWCQLQLGCEAATVEELGDRVQVTTNQGLIQASRVFDSRPRRKDNAMDGQVSLKQHFLGWHVRTQAPLFDPREATLMDFKRRDDGLIQFWYLLPFSRHEALVEATFISAAQLQPGEYEKALTAYLGQLGAASGYRVLWKEQGCLPMSTAPLPQRHSRRIYALGAAAGLLKSSTGYAFLAIQRYSEQLAKRLAAEPLPAPPRPRPLGLTLLDRIFLCVLAHHPRRAPEIFFSLFQRVEPDRLVRFLSDVPRPADVLAVVGAMPKGLFLGEALQSMPVWLRNA